MPKKLPATGKQVRGWFLHLIVFAVVNAILWYICKCYFMVYMLSWQNRMGLSLANLDYRCMGIDYNRARLPGLGQL
jgi:hypothetical protein